MTKASARVAARQKTSEIQPMPNDFSIEIHKFLSASILEAEKRLAANDDPFYRGRLMELLWIRNYLQENFDLKNFVYF